MIVLVVGGGAAGMMAALSAAENGAAVTLLEKNEKLGKKVYITGKGRCNLTNACGREEFFEHIRTNPRFLYSSFSRFSNESVMSLLEEAGLKLKTERGGRVFPASDFSGDVLDTLRRLLKAAGVTVLLHTEVRGLILEDDRCRGVRVRQTESGKESELAADRVILATGGLSYPSTGSTGDGLKWAGETGHRVRKCTPSLVPLNAVFENGEPTGPLMGLTLKNVGASFRQGKKTLASGFGELIFTHFGASGPIILTASGDLAAPLEAAGERGPVTLHLDLKPALSEEQLKERFLRESTESGAPARQVSTLLGGWMPRALIPFVLAEAGIPETEKAGALTKAARGRLLAAVKDLRLTVTGLRGFEEAIVTRGGVEAREIDPATMASRRVRGLYFAGEMIDLDGTTGGFNLQIAWTTGHAAGEAAAKEEKIMNRHIAIDGPAGSGKSTIAKAVAARTGLIYVDTGAMYRAMAVDFLRKGLDEDDEAGISRAAEAMDVTIGYENGQQQVFLNGENVTPLLRREEVGRMASASSVYAAVRAKMKVLQQKLAAEKNVVMDGRDIGTVILPDAFLKIYMTAGVEVRARRRFDELAAKGQAPDFETICREIEERDYRDMHREIAPLKQAADAVLLDTSALNIEEVTERVLALYREKEKQI